MPGRKLLNKTCPFDLEVLVGAAVWATGRASASGEQSAAGGGAGPVLLQGTASAPRGPTQASARRTHRGGSGRTAFGIFPSPTAGLQKEIWNHQGHQG